MEAIKQAIKLKKETKLKCLLGVSDAPGNIGVIQLQNSDTDKENDDATYSLFDDEELPPIFNVADGINLEGNTSDKIAEGIADEALNGKKEENKNFLESRGESEEWMSVAPDKCDMKMTRVTSIYIPSWWVPTYRDLLTLSTNSEIQSDNDDPDFPDHKESDLPEDEVRVEDITCESQTPRYGDAGNTAITQTNSKKGRLHKNRNVILRCFRWIRKRYRKLLL